jgi:hypothetical protein
MAQEKHIFPFVGSTIRTLITYAFVMVAGARQSGARDIKQNTTDRTFLLHAFLVEPEIWGCLILPDCTEDCEEISHKKPL